MRTTKKLGGGEKITVDTQELQRMLGCGRKSAVDIGMAAESRIQIGRRVLWNTNKIRKYLEVISE